MINQTINKLESLKLSGMAQALKHQFETTSALDLSFEERIALIVDTELTHRENLRLKRLLNKAKLKETASAEDIDYNHPRGLDKPQMRSLISLDWMTKGLNLIFTGPAGCGKTWLSCALGNQACRHGYATQFSRVPLLLEELTLSHADGSFRRKLMLLAKLDLLVLDDFGIGALSQINRGDLLEIADIRSGKATIITSQIPVDKWHDYLSSGNPTLADAILDRFCSSAMRVNLKGESMRSRRLIETQ